MLICIFVILVKINVLNYENYVFVCNASSTKLVSTVLTRKPSIFAITVFTYQENILFLFIECQDNMERLEWKFEAEPPVKKLKNEEEMEEATYVKFID